MDDPTTILPNQTQVLPEVVEEPTPCDPPILREVPNTPHHIFNDQLAAQIRDLGRLGLSKNSAMLAARVRKHVFEKYYLQSFLEGQSEMQKGLAAVAVQEAMNGNTPILLHLLKTKLGWSEQQQLEITGEVRSIVSAAPLSKEEFIKKYLNKDDNSSSEEL